MQDNSSKQAGTVRKVRVLGAGAWGTAVAIALAQRHQVLMWGRNSAGLQAMGRTRENTDYLPGYAFPAGLDVAADFDAALAHASGDDGLLIAACPVAGLRPLLEQLKPHGIRHVVWLCKGFEYDTGLLPHQIVREVL